jgi:hypothetical protein
MGYIYMPIVKTVLDDAAYKKLVKMRKKEGVPSVSALFLKKCGLLTDEGEANELVIKALLKAKSKQSGAEFRLRSLFPTSDWEQFSKGARLRAGKIFHGKISLATDGIRIGKKSSSGHQFYRVA